MNAKPLAELTFGADDGVGVWSDFDPFTPHLKILSLGGVHVNLGGWSAGELLLALGRAAHADADTITAHGCHTQLSVQLNAARITWVSSLLGLVESRVGVVILDARCGPAWLEHSVKAACDELSLWRATCRRLGDDHPLNLSLWVERSESDARVLERDIEHAITRFKRLANAQHAKLTVMGEGAALVSDEDARRLWAQLKRAFIKLSEEERLWSEQRICIDHFTLIPAGDFYQGGRSLSASSEKPKHRVKISHHLWVSQAPITEQLWTAVMGERHSERSQSHLPVTLLSWFDALRFCNHLSELEGLARAYEIEDHALPKVTWRADSRGYRLLTESEWEYACRGGVIASPTAPASPLPPAWTAQRAQLTTHTVAQLTSNPWGLYDCLGNVSEWCQDTYDADIYQRRALERLSINPCERAHISSERVTRGGGFDTEPYFATPSRRDSCEPTSAWSNIGLRVARPVYKT